MPTTTGTPSGSTAPTLLADMTPLKLLRALRSTSPRKQDGDEEEVQKTSIQQSGASTDATVKELAHLISDSSELEKSFKKTGYL